MSTEIETLEEGVRLRRTFDADRSRVFSAWVEADKVGTWWGCARTTRTVSRVEPRVGGAYRHLMTMEGFGDFESVGIFVEFEAPLRFAYTMEMPAMEGLPPLPTQRIAVEFGDAGAGCTAVTLTHAGIPVDAIKDEVRKGWNAAFAKLADRIETAEV